MNESLALTADEKQQLTRLEAAADKCLKESADNLWRFARHLKLIRDQRLYRPKTWENYCAERFSFRAETCNRWIRALEVGENLSASPAMLLEPVRESQTRPLQQLSPGQQATAWQIATTQAEGGQPTQRQVANAADVVTQIQEGMGVMLHQPPPHMRFEDVWAVAEVGELDGQPAALISMGGEPIWMPLTNIRGVIERIPPTEMWDALGEKDPMETLDEQIQNLDQPKAKPKEAYPEARQTPAQVVRGQQDNALRALQSAYHMLGQCRAILSHQSIESLGEAFAASDRLLSAVTVAGQSCQESINLIRSIEVEDGKKDKG